MIYLTLRSPISTWSSSPISRKKSARKVKGARGLAAFFRRDNPSALLAPLPRLTPLHHSNDQPPPVRQGGWDCTLGRLFASTPLPPGLGASALPHPDASPTLAGRPGVALYARPPLLLPRRLPLLQATLRSCSPATPARKLPSAALLRTLPAAAPTRAPARPRWFYP